jgi:hypothetical protein
VPPQMCWEYWHFGDFVQIGTIGSVKISVTPFIKQENASSLVSSVECKNIADSELFPVSIWTCMELPSVNASFEVIEWRRAMLDGFRISVYCLNLESPYSVSQILWLVTVVALGSLDIHLFNKWDIAFIYLIVFWLCLSLIRRLSPDKIL